jgi:hypothetical protein
LSPTVLDARSLISSPPRRGLADHSTGSLADFCKLIADKPRSAQGDPGGQYQAGVIIGNTPDISITRSLVSERVHCKTTAPTMSEMGSFTSFLPF